MSTKYAVTISAALVGKMQRSETKRRAMLAETWKMKLAEDAIKDQIKKAMGRHRTAAVGTTGRVVELTTVKQPKKVIGAYSYVQVKVVEAA